MKIRTALVGDAQGIADVHTASWRNNYQSVLSAQYLADVVPRERNELWLDRLTASRPTQYVAVAERDDKIIGFACVYAGENPRWGSYVDNLHVRKAYQSKGIGRSLLLQVACWCYRQNPTEGLCLLVNQSNVKAQGFYQSLSARNAQESVWHAPDDSIVPTYWFVCDKLDALVKMANEPKGPAAITVEL